MRGLLGFSGMGSYWVGGFVFDIIGRIGIWEVGFQGICFEEKAMEDPYKLDPWWL